jgi:hypothetical protein
MEGRGHLNDGSFMQPIPLLLTDQRQEGQRHGTRALVIQMTTFTPLIAAFAPRHAALLLFAQLEQKEGGGKKQRCK